MQGGGLAMLLGVVIVALILASVVMAGFMLINGSLSRRSVCWSFMVLCVSAYSIVGYLWTAGSDDLILSWTYMFVSAIVFTSFMYSAYVAFLSLLPIKNKVFTTLVIAGAVPAVIYTILNIWLTPVAYIEDGARLTFFHVPIMMAIQYIHLLTYIGLAVYCARRNVKLANGAMKKRAKMALIGLVSAVVLGLSFEVGLGMITSYGHSMMHVAMFLLVFLSYKAFMDEPVGS